MNFKKIMNNKYIVILLFLILGVLFLNNFYTIREGNDPNAKKKDPEKKQKDLTAAEAQALSKDIGKSQDDIKNKLEKAGVPVEMPDTTGILDQLTDLFKMETARSTERADAEAAAAQNTSPADNTVPPNIIDNSFFLGNSFSDVFCNRYAGTQLENKCSELTEDNCNITDCCVFVNGTKCMAGSARGPKNTPAFKTDTDYYLYKYQCYGNCELRKQQLAKKVKQPKINCSDNLTIVSTTCFNQHVADLKCNNFSIPPDFRGESNAGLVIENNQLNLKRHDGLNWGIVKKMMTAQIKARPSDCSKTNVIKDAFNIKN